MNMNEMKLCKDCIFMQTWFGNWSPTDLCMHKTKSYSLIYGETENRGLLTVYNQRYDDWKKQTNCEINTCGKEGRWFKQKPDGFDKLTPNEKEKEWTKCEETRW